MAKKPFFRDWKKFLAISFGLVYILFMIWTFVHVPEYFPEGQHNHWYLVMSSYIVINTLLFSNADIRNRLFNVKFIKMLPKLLMAFFGSLIFFYIVLKRYDPFQYEFFSLLAAVPVWLALVHGITFATTESLLQVYLTERIGPIGMAIFMGILHYGIWSGGALFVVIGAGTLFLLFQFVHYIWSDGPYDFAAIIGVHTAFNFIKLGLDALGGVI